MGCGWSALLDYAVAASLLLLHLVADIVDGQAAAQIGVYRVRREVGRMGCYVGRVRENHESGVLANYGRMGSTGV